MIEVAYSQDVDAVDQQARAAAAESSDLSVKIRVQPYLYRGKQYVPWEGARWLLQAENAEEAIELRSAMEWFFELVKRTSPAEAKRLIASVI